MDIDEHYQAEVAHRLGEATNPERFEFLRTLLNLMPDDELKRVVNLSNNALKRRCRSQKSGTKKMRTGHDEAVLPLNKGITVANKAKESVKAGPIPVSTLQKVVPVLGPVPSKGKADVKPEAWYDKYRSADFVFIDVEKVEEKSDGKTKNAKGKPKEYEMKAGEVALCDINGCKILETKIYRKPGSFRINPKAKNKFKTLNCLEFGRKIEDVQEDLRTRLKGKCVVGVDMAEDFKSLDLQFGEFSENAFDLQWFYFDDLVSSRGTMYRERWALRRMCKELFGREIQTGDHTALDDARSTAAVFRKYMEISPAPIKKIRPDMK